MSEKGTEAATEQRKQKARQKGDVVRSRELLSSVSMLAGVLVMGVSATQFVSAWDGVYARTLALGMGGARTNGLDRALMQQALRILAPSLVPVAMILVASFGAALFAGVGQSGGITVRGDALQLKFERLNPVTNLGNIFSMRSLTRMLKSLLPAAVVVMLGSKALKEMILPMPVMSAMRLTVTLGACFDLMVKAAWVMVLWSGFDYAMERMAWNKKLRMSKQELRDEMKEAMGNPEVKRKIRQIQNAMRKRRMKADINRASVVITNPTHYAVALEFSFELMLAPTVLVKGKNLHAKKIREEAQWAGVPIIENPPLARSLYKSVEEGQSIPYDLYAAVAGILAFLYRQEVEKAARDRRAAEELTKMRGMRPEGMGTAGSVM
ncbi:MAG TPA: EscU/YscU/HrcU family type III secretion system export apparatus switch protein [Acidobacteriaceae bacterium]|nr:EscU/YscU/HrcU family type III secretion system export apparatus switch protein [Acidobacteriaceae bacterium]